MDETALRQSKSSKGRRQGLDGFGWLYPSSELATLAVCRALIARQDRRRPRPHDHLGCCRQRSTCQANHTTALTVRTGISGSFTS